MRGRLLSHSVASRRATALNSFHKENAKIVKDGDFLNATLPHNVGQWANSIRQFFRVSLPPGGTLEISGEIENAWSSGIARLVAEVRTTKQTGFTAPNTQVGSITGPNLDVPANSTVSFSTPPSSKFTNNWVDPQAPTKPTEYYVVLRSNSGTAAMNRIRLEVHSQDYAPDSSCLAPYNGPTPPWNDNRTVVISTSFSPTERADVVRAIDQWNARLASIGSGAHFTVTTVTPADINLLAVDLPDDVGGNWVETSPGRGNLEINADFVLQGSDPEYNNLIWEWVLHEFGHVLDHSDVNSSNCNSSDTVMFDPIGPTSPLAGITETDKAAVAAVRLP